MFYLVKTPWLVKKIYPEYLWNIKTAEKVLYLTFDDGPHPEATTFVLSELKKYNAHATFFCIGKNVAKHFDLHKQLINEGHQAANHTYHHLNGWKTKDNIYINDVKNASQIIDSNLFRPPYGKITRFQAKALIEGDMRLQTVMWDVLSGDFDNTLSNKKCYENVTKNAECGSIIVFHDSPKALPRLQYALPKVLEYFARENYSFQTIPEAL